MFVFLKKMFLWGVCVCACVCVEGATSLVTQCDWAVRWDWGLREQTMLITQVNKYADEQQQWNNGNTIGNDSSVAETEDNYSYRPTPFLPFKHPLLLYSPMLRLSILFIYFLLQWLLSLSVFFVSLLLPTIYLLLSTFFFYPRCN